MMIVLHVILCDLDMRFGYLFLSVCYLILMLVWPQSTTIQRPAQRLWWCSSLESATSSRKSAYLSMPHLKGWDMLHSWSVPVHDVSVPIYAMLRGLWYTLDHSLYRKSVYLSIPPLKGWDMLHSWSLPVQEVSIPICAMYPSMQHLKVWDMLHTWSLSV